MLAAMLFLLPGVVPAQDPAPLLERLSEEAEVFRHQLPQALSEETLIQRAVKPPGRFRPRVGKAALKPPEPTLQTREIVSEYSLGTLNSAPGAIHEFRQVTSVDGKQVNTAEKARHALVLGLRSENDRERHRMLEQFQKYGLRGAAVEFAPAILLFTKRQVGHYQFHPGPPAQIGADACQTLAFKQVSGPESMLVFTARETVHAPLEGQVYLRQSDGLPVRIVMVAARTESGHQFREEAAVDYDLSQHGFLEPVSAVHRGFVDGKLYVEDLFKYKPFRKFTADTEIKFTEVPEPPK